MTKAIEGLLANSGLPGPRANLELLYSFARSAAEDEVRECLSYVNDDLHDSPEEFVAMCGIIGWRVLNKDEIDKTLTQIRPYASHGSWRVREAVAIGIQEMSGDRTDEIVSCLEAWVGGNDLEKRAVVAVLCEPKLLIEPATAAKVLDILRRITTSFAVVGRKLSDDQQTLRKALEYGWSVAIVAFPNEGKRVFEEMVESDNAHIRWIVKENLKKRRLSAMDAR